jgi:HTH-type transcriptional regulator/antitoxin HigA
MIVEPAINARRYGKLLAKTLPAVIDTEEENERMLAAIEPLFDKGKDRTPEEDRLYKLMLHLIQDFEDKHYDFHATTPLNILKHLMEVRGVKPKDLWDVFGTRSVTSEVLSGKRAISKTHAKRLAQFFNVSADLFI